MDKQLLNEMNNAYYILELKEAEIFHALFHRIFDLESGWDSGHYYKDDNGKCIEESVPVGCAHYEMIYDSLVNAIENGKEKCVKDEEVIKVLEILEEATEVAKSHRK